MKKKVLKITALLIAVVLITRLGIFANSLVGNPVSKMLAERTAETYLAEEYEDTDFYIENIGFNFKDGNYYVHVKSPSSIDTYFTLYISMSGNLERDTYSDVLNGWNTANRLNETYCMLVDTVLKNPSFPYRSEIAFGRLECISRQWLGQHDVPSYALIEEDLEIDKLYDITKLGTEAGHLIIYVDDETVSIERAAEIMLDVKHFMDEGGVPFYAMDFVLQYPRTEDDEARPGGSIHILNFLYTDIYERGMTERVQAANDAALAYYAEQDKQKLAEEPITK